MKEKLLTTKNVVLMGMFGALAGVLMLFEFPLPFLAPSFYGLDVSEVPVLIGTFAMGLKDKADSSVKIPAFRQQPGSPQKRGHMPVMTAGMHPVRIHGTMGKLFRHLLNTDAVHIFPQSNDLCSIPTFRVPTTPVFPILVSTSIPISRSRFATNAAVFICHSKCV